MNNRITLPALAKALAADTGHTRKQCEDFLRELFSICSEALAKGEDVKVRGLGVFRIVEVEERKSVNVATGAEFVIPAHKKVAFAPCEKLASAVNVAFDMFVPVEIEENVDAGNEEPEDVENLTDDSEESDSYYDLEDDFDFALSDDSEQDKDLPEPTAESEELSFGQKEESAGTSESDSAGSAACDNEFGTEGSSIIFEEDAVGDESSVDEISAVENYEPVYEIAPAEARVDSDSEEEPNTEAYANVSCNETTEAEVGKVADAEIEERATAGRKSHGKCQFCWGVLTGFVGALVLCGAACLIYMWCGFNFSGDKETTDNVAIPAPTDTTESEKEVLPVDSIKVAGDSSEVRAGEKTAEIKDDKNEVATAPSDVATVTDVISTTRFLTTMAREHYGNDAFWPYIYEENKAFLRHPDRIKPGTKVVVPSLAKYGVDPKKTADIRKAKQLGIEIYSRYKK